MTYKENNLGGYYEKTNLVNEIVSRSRYTTGVFRRANNQLSYRVRFVARLPLADTLCGTTKQK
jgi:hypothetical protein